MRTGRIEPGPGQESVWDYPRPPRVESTASLVRVKLAGVTVAETRRALRVLETSHPPTIYIPLADVERSVLRPSDRVSLCEFKGSAIYFDLVCGEHRSADAAWLYPDPHPDFALLRDHVAFYPSRVDACFIDDERVEAQDGDFYGGWITRRVVGPFKGGVGTRGW